MDASWAQTGATGVFTVILAYLVWPLRGRVKDIESRCPLHGDRLTALEAHYEDIQSRLERIERKLDDLNGGR